MCASLRFDHHIRRFKSGLMRVSMRPLHGLCLFISDSIGYHVRTQRDNQKLHLHEPRLPKARKMLRMRGVPQRAKNEAPALSARHQEPVIRSQWKGTSRGTPRRRTTRR